MKTHHSNLKCLHSKLLHELLTRLVHNLVLDTLETTVATTWKNHKMRRQSWKRKRNLYKTSNWKNEESGCTGDGVDEVDCIGEAAEMGDSPIKGVLAVWPMIDSYDYVTAPSPLAGFPVEFGGGYNWYHCRQTDFSPVILFLLLQRLHSRISSLYLLCLMIDQHCIIRVCRFSGVTEFSYSVSISLSCRVYRSLN